jgi:hypothetical protein
LALLLCLLLAPLELLGVLQVAVDQAKEVVSSSEARVLGAKVVAELPTLGARISEFLRSILPPIN